MPQAETEKGKSSAVIYKGDMRIEISESISDEFLMRIMRAAAHV